MSVCVCLKAWGKSVFNNFSWSCLCVIKVRSRGLPGDHAGPIRIINIEGIDVNTCCGTHVSNLSHLQVGLHSYLLT